MADEIKKTEDKVTDPADTKETVSDGDGIDKSKSEKTYTEDQFKAVIKEREDLKEKYRKTKEMFQDLTPEALEEYKKLKKEQEEAHKKALEAKGEWDTLRANLIKEHDKEVAEWRNKYDGRESYIRKMHVDSKIRSAATQWDAIDPQDIVDLMRSKFLVEQIGEDYEAFLTNERGDKASNKKTGDPIGVEEAVKDFLAAKPHLVKPDARPGSGHTRTQTGKPGATEKLVEDYQKAMADGQIELAISLKNQIYQVRNKKKGA